MTEKLKENIIALILFQLAAVFFCYSYSSILLPTLFGKEAKVNITKMSESVITIEYSNLDETYLLERNIEDKNEAVKNELKSKGQVTLVLYKNYAPLVVELKDMAVLKLAGILYFILTFILLKSLSTNIKNNIASKNS